MFYLIGIIISFFLCLLLILKRNKSNADKILTVWMALIAIHQCLFYVEHSAYSLQYPHLLGITFALPLLHGILLFLYVSEITTEKPILFQKVFPHFIPFLLLILLALPFYTLSAHEKVEVFENEGKGFEWFSLLQFILIVLSGLIYVFFSLRLIHKYRKNIQYVYSNTDKKNLQWLEYLSIGLGLIWLLVVFFDDWVIFSGVVVLVLFIGFFGINQLPVFYAHPELKEVTPFQIEKPLLPEMEKSQENISRYEKSGLKEEEANQVYELLTSLMEKEALYKKNDLTLDDLAKRINIHPNYLSQVINQKEQKNFYHYINTLRVEEFIRISSLPKNKQFTLLALAHDCGFNSKSTFNKYFKQNTGKTPSEYFNS